MQFDMDGENQIELTQCQKPKKFENFNLSGPITSMSVSFLQHKQHASVLFMLI